MPSAKALGKRPQQPQRRRAAGHPGGANAYQGSDDPRNGSPPRTPSTRRRSAAAARGNASRSGAMEQRADSGRADEECEDGDDDDEGLELNLEQSDQEQKSDATQSSDASEDDVDVPSDDEDTTDTDSLYHDDDDDDDRDDLPEPPSAAAPTSSSRASRSKTEKIFSRLSRAEGGKLQVRRRRGAFAHLVDAPSEWARAGQDRRRGGADGARGGVGRGRGSGGEDEDQEAEVEEEQLELLINTIQNEPSVGLSDWQAYAGDEETQPTAPGQPSSQRPRRRLGRYPHSVAAAGLDDATAVPGGEEPPEDERTARRRMDDEMEMMDYAFENELRGAGGFKKFRAQRGRKRRATAEENLSRDVRALLAGANELYIEGSPHEAIAKLEEVIRIEPAVKSAWATLSHCYAELDNPEKELQCKIVQAHLSSQPLSLWVELAETSAELGLGDQAVYCYAQAIKCSRERDRSDVLDLMWKKAQQLLAMGEERRAADAMASILRYRPHNEDVTRQLVPLLVATEQTARAIDMLERSFEYNLAAFPDPRLDPMLFSGGGGAAEGGGADGATTTTTLASAHCTFGSSEAVTLADLHLLHGDGQRALGVVRRAARWLQGRAHETFWDEVEADDREFDPAEGAWPERVPRPTSRHEARYGLRVERARPHDLEPEMRVRLGLARSRLDDIEEAQFHLGLWMSQVDMSQHLSHSLEIAKEYLRHGNAEEAEAILLQLLETYGNEEMPSGAIHEQIDPGEVFELYVSSLLAQSKTQQAIDNLNSAVARNPDVLEYKLRLAELYEQEGDYDAAIELVNDVADARARLASEGQEPDVDEEQDDDAPNASLLGGGRRRAGRGGVAGSGRGRGRGLTGFAAMNALRRDKRGLTRAERVRIERDAEEQTRASWLRLQARRDEVFVHRWWHADTPLSEQQARQRHRHIGFLQGRTPTPTLRASEGTGRETEANRSGRGETRASHNSGEREDVDSEDEWEDDPAEEVPELGRPFSQPRAHPTPRTRRRFEAVKEWLADAQALVETFRNTTQLFPREKGRRFKGMVLSRNPRSKGSVESHMNAILARLHNDMVAEEEQAAARHGRAVEVHAFRGLHFEDWLDLFVRYAFLQTRMGNFGEARECLEHALKSSAVGPFRPRELRLRLCLVGCALHARQFAVAFEELRWMAREWQFHNEPLRIALVLGHWGGHGGWAALTDSRHSKSYLRRARTHEAIVSGMPKELHAASGRWQVRGGLSKSKTIRKGTGGAFGGGEMADGEARSGEDSADDDDDDDDDLDLDDAEEDDDEAGEADEGRPNRRGGRRGSAKAAAATARGGTEEADEDAQLREQRSLETLARMSEADRARCALPTKYPVVGEAFYASLLQTTQSTQGALGYWLRVFARQQNDALVCLCCGVACIARAQVRQVDNRSHMILQGMSFLALYRQLRLEACGAEPEATTAAEAVGVSAPSSAAASASRIEAEYNFGRALHGLGLTYLAVPRYEAALKVRARQEAARQDIEARLPPVRVDDDDEAVGEWDGADDEGEGGKVAQDDDVGRGGGWEGPWREAAYNLATIYALSGSTLLARGVYERWLSV